MCCPLQGGDVPENGERARGEIAMLKAGIV